MALELDFAELPPTVRYKLLVSFIVPRPIALVSSCSANGHGNAAPMSFFNVFGENPPIVILGLQQRPDGCPKDTTRNIKETGEFVVNLVDASLAEKMVICSIDFPPDVDEIQAAGLTLVASRALRPGRIAEAPAALECRLERTVEYANRSVIFGEVVFMHVRDEFIDPGTLRVRAPEYSLIARLHGDYYVTACDQYRLSRPTYQEWLQANGHQAPAAPAAD